MVFSLRKEASCFRNKPSKHSLIQTQFFPCPNTGFGNGWEASRSSWRRTIRSLSDIKKEVKIVGRRGPFVQEEGDGCVLGREDHLEEETLGEVLLVVRIMKPLPAKLWVELGEGGVGSKRCKIESRVLKQSSLFIERPPERVS